MFLDSDDYFGDKNYFQILIDEINKTDPDIINAGLIYID